MSKRSLNDIFKSNKELLDDIHNNNFLKSNLLGILKNIELSIPENARENFYKNLETLRVLSVGEQSFSLIDATVVNIDSKLNFLVNNNIKSPAGNDYEEALAMELYHELVHVAGTSIEVVDNKCVGRSGFQEQVITSDGKVEYTNESELNGITEGFTQYLTLKAFNKDVDGDSSDYSKQIIAVEKLIGAAGIDVVKSAYFDNRNGMKHIKDVLQQKGYDIDLYKQLEKECHVNELNIISGENIKPEHEQGDSNFIETLKEQKYADEEVAHKYIEESNNPESNTSISFPEI